MASAADTLSPNDVNRELYIRNAELAVRNKTLSLLRTMSDVTARTLETQEMVHEIVHTLRREFLYPFVAMALMDGTKKHLVWRSFSSAQPKSPMRLDMKELLPIMLSSTTNICIKSLRTNRRHSTAHVSCVFDEIAEVKKTSFKVETRFKSALVLPLSSNGAAIGVLVVGLDRAATALSRYERETFQSLLGLVAIALQKAETYEHLQKTTKQLRVANHHLRELDAMKTEFLSFASHQLRTPLAVLKGYIGMLNGNMLGALSEKQKETLTRMDSGTEQLIMLVNHLLDVSRIESNRLQVRLEPVDLRTVLEGLVKFLEAKANEKHLAVVYAPPASPMMVSVDLEKIKEVFMNLLDNAIKYTDEGSVTISVGVEDRGIRVDVQDTGHGLTPEDHTKLFQKFATGSASKKVRTTTGVGLYVVKKLVEAMQGTVVATSDGVERGSVFTVRFPQLHL